MRIGKLTRLERQMHRRIIQQHVDAWMEERGYEPSPSKFGAVRRSDTEGSGSPDIPRPTNPAASDEEKMA